MSRKEIMSYEERKNAINELSLFCTEQKGQHKAKALLEFLQYEQMRRNAKFEGQRFTFDDLEISLATAYRYLGEYKKYGIKGIQDDKQIIVQYLQYHPMCLAEKGTIAVAWTRSNLASFINKNNSVISRKLCKHPITEHMARMCLNEFVNQYHTKVQKNMIYDIPLHIVWGRVENSCNLFGEVKYQIRYCVNKWEYSGKDIISVKECRNQTITAYNREKITNKNLAGAILGEIFKIKERHKIEANVIIYLPDGNVRCEAENIIGKCATLYIKVGKNKKEVNEVLLDLEKNLISKRKMQEESL